MDMQSHDDRCARNTGMANDREKQMTDSNVVDFQRRVNERDEQPLNEMPADIHSANREDWLDVSRQIAEIEATTSWRCAIIWRGVTCALVRVFDAAEPQWSESWAMWIQ